MVKHVCRNRYGGDGAKGACYFEIEETDTEGIVALDVGWSCVGVHRGNIPVSWLSELIAIATAHKDGVAGFLREHEISGESYALMCDPPSLAGSEG